MEQRSLQLVSQDESGVYRVLFITQAVLKILSEISVHMLQLYHCQFNLDQINLKKSELESPFDC